MKGKFRILGRSVLGAFLVCALMLAVIPALPVAAEGATAVTEVWVEFPFTTCKNESSDADASNIYLVHFKPTTAMSRGVDTVTITWPDGSATMCGTVSTDLAFTVGSSMTVSNVDFSTNYDTSAVTAATWTDCTTAGTTCGGYRTKVETPIDIAAGSDVWVRFDPSDGELESGATAGSSFKVYVGTSQDITPVLSSAFTLDSTVGETLATSVSPATAGAAAQYSFTYLSTTGLTQDTDTVTIMFPVGTTLPSSISAANVQFSSDNSTYTASSSTPTVDTDKRTVTATTSASITAGHSCAVKILSGAGITNPTIASTTTAYKCMVRDSQDGKWLLQTTAHTISAGSATTITVCNGEIGAPTSLYSDDATMVNMYSSQIYVTLADAYGNAKAPSSAKTVTLATSSGTGAFYTDIGDELGAGAMTSATSISVDAADPNVENDGEQIVYYKDSAAGTHTLTFSHGSYTNATWTITVAPGVSLYDSNDNLVDTFAPASNTPASETSSSTCSTVSNEQSVDYINDAVTAAMAGDTVKLGDGTYEVDDSSYINLNEKVTLTSVNGASSTTIRNTEEIDKAISVGISGTSTNPVIIDGITFQRLRSGGSHDIDCVVYNNGYDYVTVQNNIFNYITPDESTSQEAVVWTRSYTNAITSSTVSNNTFNNCCGFNGISGGATRAGSIYFGTTSCSNAMSGVTVSGNTLTDCNDYGIQIRGSASYLITATVTNNTITNGYSSLNLSDYMTLATLTGNTITGGYNYGICVEGTHNTAVKIKNNTITGSATGNNGYGIWTEEDGAVVTIQYNDIYDNSTYAIQSTAYPQDCKYNWYGDATGPAYTALSSANVSKSNPNGTGNKISDYVTYYPWLHKSRVDVVNDNVSYQTSTMKLVAGWNTLSTPMKLISTADSIDELISTDDMEIGYYYDSGWQQITTGKVLDACDAVYVKMLSAKYVQFKFDAGAWTMPSKDLAVGWNLVGLAYLASGGMDADEAVASVYKTAANLPGYSQVIGPSLIDVQTDLYGSTSCASFAYSSGETSADANMMYAGLGYWVYMQNAATLAGFTITPIVPDLD